MKKRLIVFCTLIVILCGMVILTGHASGIMDLFRGMMI